MSRYLSLMVKDGILENVVVSREVWIYVHQLEAYIRDPKNSKLLEIYPGRFDPLSDDRILQSKHESFDEFCVKNNIVEETE